MQKHEVHNTTNNNSKIISHFETDPGNNYFTSNESISNIID